MAARFPRSSPYQAPSFNDRKPKNRLIRALLGGCVGDRGLGVRRTLLQDVIAWLSSAFLALIMNAHDSEQNFARPCGQKVRHGPDSGKESGCAWGAAQRGLVRSTVAMPCLPEQLEWETRKRFRKFRLEN